MVLSSVLIKEHLNCIRNTAQNNKLQKDRKDLVGVCVMTYFNKIYLPSIVTRIHAGRLGNRHLVLDGGKYFSSFHGAQTNLKPYLFNE